MPAKIIDDSVDPSTWAFGNQIWTGAKGTLTIIQNNKKIKAKNKAVVSHQVKDDIKFDLETRDTELKSNSSKLWIDTVPNKKYSKRIPMKPKPPLTIVKKTK